MHSVFKEPGPLAARCYHIPSPPRIQKRQTFSASTSASGESSSPRSTQTLDDDDVIEVFGPFEVKGTPNKLTKPKLMRVERSISAEASNMRNTASKMKETLTLMQPETTSLHPFFKRAAGVKPRSQPLSTLADSLQTLTIDRNIPPLNGPSPRPATQRQKPPALSVTSEPAQSLKEDSRLTKESNEPIEREGKQQPELYSYKYYEPPPARVYVTNEDEANDLVSMLKGPIGFDMEWRVLYTRSRSEPTKVLQCRTATVQVCDEQMILVIQVHGMRRFPERLKEIIESKDIVKMGANILNDGVKLFGDYGVVAHNLVELGALARHADPGAEALFLMRNGKPRKSASGIASLAKVVARYCGKTLEKPKERTSNWEASLTERQLEYAANDAHSALMAYLQILEIARKNQRTLTPSEYTRHVGSSVSGLISDEELDEEDSTTVDTEAQSTTIEQMATTGTEATATDAAPVVIPLTHTGMRAQYWRAYRLWHGKGMELDDLCKTLSVEGPPLKRSTVISYIIGALQADATLSFDMKKLRDLVQMEAKSWTYHKPWIMEAGRMGRGVGGAGRA